MGNKDILNFIFEMNQLKRIKHEGWRLIGIKDPESVADHSLRSAQIGYILAKLEKYDNPYEVCAIAIFHDIPEARIGNIHRLANRYIKVDGKEVVREQTEKLEGIGEDISGLWDQAERRSTVAGVIAKDADRLDQAMTAKEYMEKGYGHAEGWIDNIEKSIRTGSAKCLLAELRSSDSNAWWQGLKKLKG